MTAEALEATTNVVIVEPVPLSDSVRMRILLYLGMLIVLLGFGAPGGGLIGLPISFILKNKLHLKAHEVAQFGFVAGAPVYLSFLFGFARDVWNPFGMRDRGFMVLFGAICAGLYVYFAFTPVNYASLLLAVLLVRTSFLFVSSAQNGLTSAIGQQHVMSGQVSAAWNIFGSLPGIAALLVGGSLSDLLEGRSADRAAHSLFLVGAAIMGVVALYGFWKPPSVFDNVRVERGPRAHALDDFKRLIKHWPVYPALLIWLLWNFAPGSVTPLQFYLQNTLHAKDAQWGQWNAIFSASFIPTFMLYGVLCRKFPLRSLLFWGTVVAVPQMVPLLFIHSVTGALIAAAPIGLMGGVATAAYMDLLIRACPPGLQGSILMMSVGLYEVVTRLGDLLGTNLYDHFGGFKVCVIAITTVYALILPTLLLIPKRLIATADGETPTDGLAAT
ncbi:MAG: MFS transporter [Caulobacterales bacterium]